MDIKLQCPLQSSYIAIMTCKGHSRSLVMALIDNMDTISY